MNQRQQAIFREQGKNEALIVENRQKAVFLWKWDGPQSGYLEPYIMRMVYRGLAVAVPIAFLFSLDFWMPWYWAIMIQVAVLGPAYAFGKVFLMERRGSSV